MNEQYLEAIQPYDVSILKDEDNKAVLILLCKDAETCDKLYEFIQSNKHLVKVGLTKDKTVKITVQFPDLNLFFGLHIQKTITQYPPLEWLVSGNVNFLTTGYRLPDKSLEWSCPYLNLVSPTWN